MTGIVSAVLFCLSLVLLPCEGNIIIPDDGDTFVVVPGGTLTIEWKIDPVIPVSDLKVREWWFGNIALAEIIHNQNVTIKTGNIFSPWIDIIKPSTLVLRNVGERFNGEYSFRIRVGPTLQLYTSVVKVFVAVTPMISVDCSRLTTVNTSDDFTCTCKGPGGNPPADVTWYKDDEQIGFAEREVKTLHLNNVNRTTSGKYRCEAKSHKNATNETEIKLIVNYPPDNLGIMLTKIGNIGIRIECSADAHPLASFKIFLNETKEVASAEVLTIPNVNSSHVGNYTCSAWNILGGQMSAPKYLSLKGPATEITPTPATLTISTSIASQTVSTSNGTEPTPTTTPTPSPGLPIGAIIGIVVGVFLLIIIVALVVYCCKSKEKKSGKRANIDQVSGNHYELEHEEPVPDDGAYDTVGPVGASDSKSKPSAGHTLPPVYAAVDKNNRQGNTLYASLDREAMQSSPQTEYARIDFIKADLV